MTKRELIEALEALDVPDDAPILRKEFDRDGDWVGLIEAKELEKTGVKSHRYSSAYSGKTQTFYCPAEGYASSIPGVVIEF
jgi:hypothetical protein